MAGEPKPRIVNKPEIEMFFNDVMAAGLKHNLHDREIVAVLAACIGRVAGFAKEAGAEEDYNSIVATVVFNMKKNFDDTAALMAAMGKPN